MQNAHLRLGLLEYERFTEKISTRIRVRVDRYVGVGRKAHLLSALAMIETWEQSQPPCMRRRPSRWFARTAGPRRSALDSTPPATKEESVSLTGSVGRLTQYEGGFEALWQVLSGMRQFPGNPDWASPGPGAVHL